MSEPIVSTDEIIKHIQETFAAPVSSYFTILLEQIKARDERIAELERQLSGVREAIERREKSNV